MSNTSRFIFRGHCLSLDEFTWRFIVKRLVGPLVVVLVSAASEPLFGAVLTVSPEEVEAVNSDSHSLEAFFHVVPDSIVKPTAQFVT